MTITDIAFGIIPIANILVLQTLWVADYLEAMYGVWKDEGDE